MENVTFSEMKQFLLIFIEHFITCFDVIHSLLSTLQFLPLFTSSFKHFLIFLSFDFFRSRKRHSLLIKSILPKGGCSKKKYSSSNRRLNKGLELLCCILQVWESFVQHRLSNKYMFYPSHIVLYTTSCTNCLISILNLYSKVCLLIIFRHFAISEPMALTSNDKPQFGGLQSFFLPVGFSNILTCSPRESFPDLTLYPLLLPQLSTESNFRISGKNKIMMIHLFMITSCCWEVVASARKGQQNYLPVCPSAEKEDLDLLWQELAEFQHYKISLGLYLKRHKNRISVLKHEPNYSYQ